MKLNIKKLALIEFLIWFIILCLFVFSYRFYQYKKLNQLPNYQIFMPDVDGMIIGSPVKYMGTQIGYIKNIKLLTNRAYVRFVITKEGLELPKGVIATVEFTGLGGSKSLELYPPDSNIKTEKLILIKAPIRLHSSMNLLNDMFDKIGAIGIKFNHFTEKMELIKDNALKLTTDDIQKNIGQTDEFVNNMVKNRNNLQNKWKDLKDE